MIDFMKKNWLSVLGLVVGVLGIALSFYFYTLSKQQREPSILEVKNFAIFSSPAGFSSKGFAFVTKPDLREITKNVYVHEIAFWNKGQLSIKKSDILKEIYFEYPENVEIIDSFISSATRKEITKPINKITSQNTISISFDILEKDDGFTLQVIYASSDKSTPTAKGNIEGVKNFLFAEDLEKGNLYFGIGKFILYAFIMLIILLCFGYLVIGYEWLIQKIAPTKVEKINSFSKKILDFLIWIFLSFLVIFTCITFIKGFAKEEGINSIPIMEKIDDQQKTS